MSLSVSDVPGEYQCTPRPVYVKELPWWYFVGGSGCCALVLSNEYVMSLPRPCHGKYKDVALKIEDVDMSD